MKLVIHWDMKIGDETTTEYYTGFHNLEPVSEDDDRDFSRYIERAKVFDSLYTCSGEFLKLSKIYEGCDLRISELIELKRK